jgi:hypothetical protein
MKAKIFLRTSAILLAVQAVLHTIGGVFGKPLPGASSTAYAAMQANHFAVMGLDRSYWMFFIGFGLCVTVSMIVEALVFWLLGSLADTMGTRLRPILVVFTFGYAAYTLLSGIFFFPVPTAWDAIVVLCMLCATITLKPVRINAEL